MITKSKIAYLQVLVMELRQDIIDSAPSQDDRHKLLKDVDYIQKELVSELDIDFQEILDQCVSILSVKGKDYTVGSEDKLHNFKTVGAFIGSSPLSVLGVYFYKHVSAIFSYIKSGGQSESEPIAGRIADCINYLLLLYKMIKENEREKAKNANVSSAP